MNPWQSEVRLHLTREQFETISRALAHAARTHPDDSVKENAIEALREVSDQELLALGIFSTRE